MYALNKVVIPSKTAMIISKIANDLVLEIEIIKLDFAKKIFKKEFIEKKYINSILNNIISHLNI